MSRQVNMATSRYPLIPDFLRTQFLTRSMVILASNDLLLVNPAIHQEIRGLSGMFLTGNLIKGDD